MGKRKQDATQNVKANPAPTRLSTFSLKMTHAIAAVATAFRLRNRRLRWLGFEQPQQQKNRPGHTARMAPASHGRSFPARGPCLPNAGGSVDLCAGRRVRRPNQDRGDRHQHRTGRRHDKLGQWRAGSESKAARVHWRCRYAGSISREYSFLGRKRVYLFNRQAQWVAPIHIV